MNDIEYKDLIKRKIEKDEPELISKSNYNSGKLWDKIDAETKWKKVIPIWFYYAAASVAIILLFNFWSVNIIKNKKTEISELTLEINKFKDESLKTTQNSEIERIIDTVFVEKQLIKYLIKKKYDTVRLTKTIIKKEVSTIHDTVYVTEFINNSIGENVEDIVLNDSLQIQNKIIFSQIKGFRNKFKRKSKDKISFRIFESNKKEELYTDNSLKITLK